AEPLAAALALVGRLLHLGAAVDRPLHALGVALLTGLAGALAAHLEGLQAAGHVLSGGHEAADLLGHGGLTLLIVALEGEQLGLGAGPLGVGDRARSGQVGVALLL